MKGSKRLFSGDTEASHVRNDDTTEASLASADVTVPSLRSKNGDTNTLMKLRRPSEALLQSRRTSVALSNRISSTARGKQRVVSSPRKPSIAITRSSHATRLSEDATRSLTTDFTRMSLESSHMLAQFPPPPSTTAPPVRLVAASTSTASGSPAKPSPGLLAPPTVPAYPSSSLRAGRNEDLTRFVSSSTASGTTLTTGSAGSFVKHAGPKQITNITPKDVPALPERVGRMVFDRVMMRWVKATALATATTDAEAPADNGLQVENDIDNESEDPFRDIESFREDDEDVQPPETHDEQHDFDDDDDESMLEKSRIEEVLDELEDVEEAELTSFSTDGPSQDFMQDVQIVDVADHIESSYTDSEPPDDYDEETGSMIPTATLDLQLQPRQGTGIVPIDDVTEPAFADTPPRFLTAAARTIAGPSAAIIATPDPPRSMSSGMPTPGPRSAMKSSSVTPVSALKDPNRSRMQTPANKIGHRRSVSFSDGKRDGPIVGIGRNIPTPEVSTSGDEDGPLASGSRLVNKDSAGFVPSARSKRIAEMLDGLENTGMCEGARV